MICVECTLPRKKQGFFTIPEEKMDDFPNKTTLVKLIYCEKPYEVRFYVAETHHGFSRLTKLFKDNEELYSTVTIRVCVIEKDKKYRLEIVK